MCTTLPNHEKHLPSASMKTSAFVALMAVGSLFTASAEEKPAPPPVSTTAQPVETDAARIARLEARVAKLEKVIESLRKAAASIPVIEIPNAPIANGKAPVSPGTRSRGPSDEDRKRYESLSEAGKEKVRNYFRDHMEEIRGAANEEARRALIMAAFDRIIAEDKPK